MPSDNGTFALFSTTFHATYPLSRRFLSNIPRWLIFSATTKQPLSHGLLTTSPSAAVPISLPFDLQHSILLRTIGSYRDLPSHRCCPHRSLSLPRALFRTRSFLRNGNFFPFFNGASSSGVDKTASHPCPNRLFRRWAPSCGHPTCPISPITSLAPPFNNWSNSSLVRCSTVKISTPLLFESSARAYTIRPLKKLSLTRRFLLQFPTHTSIHHLHLG